MRHKSFAEPSWKWRECGTGLRWDKHCYEKSSQRHTTTHISFGLFDGLPGTRFSDRINDTTSLDSTSSCLSAVCFFHQLSNAFDAIFI